MTKTFEEELLLCNTYIAHKNLDNDMQDTVRVYELKNKFKDWHSDEEFQKLKIENEVLKSDLDKSECDLYHANENLKLIEDLKNALPVIPQFVAEWIESYKSSGDTMFFAMTAISRASNYFNDLKDWWNQNNDEIFARAWLDGYTVEKPKEKYWVKLGILYFKCWDEIDAVFVVNNGPGFIDSARVFEKREDADEVAELVGGKVVKD